MRILFDTNVILDVLLAREQFVRVATELVGFVESKKIEGYLCATSITTLYYLIAKVKTKKHATDAIEALLTIFSIADVNCNVLRMAANSRFTDFEDAVQYYSGECIGMDGLVTRNVKDYKHASLPIYKPIELRGILTGL